jgi:small subunit ribosomal protein S19
MEIKRKEFAFRGKSMEELNKLGVREFAPYIKARERRTLLRQFQEIEKFISRAKKKISKNRPVKTHLRNIIIVPELVGMRVNVYNGRKFLPVDITEDMLGHRFGEFAPTRERVKHSSAGVGATKGSKFKAKK